MQHNKISFTMSFFSCNTLFYLVLINKPLIKGGLKMMGLETIRELQSEAASRAAELNSEPLIIWAPEEIRSIPSIGTYLPHGWARVSLHDERCNHGVYMGDNEGFGAYFVDSSGFGAPGEPAMTYDKLLEVVEVGMAYAIVEEGQFQVKIGVFELEE
jgi:hypothetical protein